MTAYVELPLESAHRIINHGPVVLLCTKNPEGSYNLAPIAWCCPVQKSPPQLLVVVGKRHKSYSNVFAAKEFIIAVPHAEQAEMLRQTGSVSGSECDKFAHFDINHIVGQKVDAHIPAGCVGYIECQLNKNFDTDKTDIIVGQAVAAAVNSEAFDQRLLVEKSAGKTLHHLGERVFVTPDDKVLQ